MFFPNLSFGPHSSFIRERGERSGPLFVLVEKMEREKWSLSMSIKIITFDFSHMKTSIFFDISKKVNLTIFYKRRE